MTGPRHNVAVHYMRGVAALVVALSHLILVFFGYPDLVANYLGVVPLAVAPQPGWFAAGLLAGQFGVGAFFVISGYVIPNAMSVYSRNGFLVARWWRLWPTYAAGFTMSLLILWAMHQAYGAAPWRYSAVDVAAHYLIGLRDLLGTANIDGIVWTLDIEMKFYLVAGLVYPAFAARRIVSVALVLAAAFVLSWIVALAPAGGMPGPAAQSLNLFFCLLILINMGSVLFLRDAGEISAAACAVLIGLHVAALLTCGAATSWAVGDSIHIRAVYLAAFLAFFLLRKRNAPPSSILDWLGRISYPLYIVHSVAGYSILYILTQKGIAAPISVFAAIGFSLLLSAILHLFVEVPSVRRAKACKR